MSHDDVKRLVPSVKVTRKESKVTRGAGKEKVTEFVACWDYELFYPVPDGDNVHNVLLWANKTILAARKDADKKEADARAERTLLGAGR